MPRPRNVYQKQHVRDPDDDPFDRHRCRQRDRDEIENCRHQKKTAKQRIAPARVRPPERHRRVLPAAW
jgi:hypothetical protein